MKYPVRFLNIVPLTNEDIILAHLDWPSSDGVSVVALVVPPEAKYPWPFVWRSYGTENWHRDEHYRVDRKTADALVLRGLVEICPRNGSEPEIEDVYRLAHSGRALVCEKRDKVARR